MNSLKIKILGLVTANIILIIGIVGYLNYQMQKDMLNDVANLNTTVLIETIKNSVNNAMRAGHSEEVQKIFKRIA